ncbi:hypothetical protein AB4028_13780, partial [Janibacter sp. RAF20_2_2]
MADAAETRRQSLVAVLAAEPDLELVTPAATAREVLSTPAVDVVVLLGGLDVGPGATDVLPELRAPDGPAWVVLTEVVECTEAIIAAGAHGCLAESSTPLE